MVSVPIETIKAEAKKMLKDSFLNQHVDDRLSLKQRNEMHAFLDKALARLFANYRFEIKPHEVGQLKEDIINELFGFGVIDKYIKDPLVTDILVNGPDQIYIEKEGNLEKVDASFKNSAEILAVIERMMMGSDRRLDLSTPFVDFRLEGGIRVTAVIPPIATISPYFCIRKILKGVLKFEHLLKFGTVNQKLFDFLHYCVQARLNILVTGATGVGKTTLMNLLLEDFAAQEERIVIIEDTEELIIDEKHHCLRLLTRPSNVEGKGEIDLRDLVKLSLHMRPDRLVIGEMRGEEVFQFLNAVNTGHEGSMCTLHANGTEDALIRLETLALIDKVNLYPEIIRRFIKEGIDLVINMVKLPHGTRIVAQVSDFDYENEMCIVKDIFSLDRSIVDGKELYEIKTTGHVPSFMAKLRARTTISEDFFIH